jgi:class 3 adenylate cyclase/CheY-like chemotaxis protein
MSILIVDDSSVQQLLLAAALKSAGHTNLLLATSGPQALELLASSVTPVDLMLVDLLMPEMDGLEMCRRVKADERWRDIPIIMITGNSDEESLDEAFATGVMDYITKPANKVALLARVRSALKLKAETDRRKAHAQELLQTTVQLTETLGALDEKNRSLELVLNSLAEKHGQLQLARDQSERLLLNILPRPIATRLKQEDNAVIADQFAEATVLFADLVDFTPFSAQVSPQELVTRLNEVFSLFDQLAEKHGLEKIKTIGDSYMVVGGVPLPRPGHAEAVAQMALDIVAQLPTLGQPPFHVRVGIHTGPVTAGVIGTKKFSYDLWGDTVNVASRMEEFGLPDRIQVTPATYAQLNARFVLAERGLIHIKGKGEMCTYFLLGRRDA